MTRHRSKGRVRIGMPGMVVLIPLAMVASTGVIYQASNAAFSAQTTNGTNTWSSGSVVLTDNDSGTAMFTVSGVKPGQTGTQCILVTYSGSLAANVKFYVATYTPTVTAGAPSGLGPFLNLTVEQGTGTASTGVSGSCTGFTTGSTMTSGTETLDSWSTAKTGWATGASAWSPVGSGETRAYRFTWTMQDTTGTNLRTQSALDNAQGAGTAATFAWEARNT